MTAGATRPARAHRSTQRLLAASRATSCAWSPKSRSWLLADASLTARGSSNRTAWKPAAPNDRPGPSLSVGRWQPPDNNRQPRHLTGRVAYNDEVTAFFVACFLCVPVLAVSRQIGLVRRWP